MSIQVRAVPAKPGTAETNKPPRASKHSAGVVCTHFLYVGFLKSKYSPEIIQIRFSIITHPFWKPPIDGNAALGVFSS